MTRLGESLRLTAGRMVPVLGVVVTAASYAVVTVVLHRLLTYGTARPDGGPAAAGEGPGPALLAPLDEAILSAAVSAVEQGLMVATVVSAYLFAPGVIIAAMALPVAASWRRPTRTLVLRRFGMAQASRSLQSVLRDRVGVHGHVYTLADRDISVPWYIRFPLVFTQLVFLHFRQRRIASPASVARFLAAMDVTWARNVNWTVSRWKLFAIRCSDGHWQSLVRTLSEKVDTILIDLSHPSDHLVWEIHECARGGLLAKTVILSDAAHEETARACLQAEGVDEALSPRLVVYDSVDVERLDALLPRQAPQPSKAPRSAKLLACASVVGPFVWLVALVVGTAWWADRPAETTLTQVFSELAERARQPVEREHALERLSAMIASATRSRPDRLWLDAFEAGALPLYRELWHSDPGLRRRILIDLQATGSRAAADLWRDAVSRADSLAPEDVELALNGILAARADESVPELIALFERGPNTLRVKTLLLLAALRAHPAVPLMIDAAQGQGPRATAELQRAAEGGLRLALLSPEPLWPRRQLEVLDRPPFLALAMGSPLATRERLMRAVIDRLGDHNILPAAGKPAPMALYGEVSAELLAAGFMSRGRANAILDFGAGDAFARGLVEYADRFDAALLMLRVVDGFGDVVAAQIPLLAALGVPRVAVFLDTAGVEDDAASVAAYRAQVEAKLDALGFADRHIATGPLTREDDAGPDTERAPPDVDPVLARLQSWPRRAEHNRSTRFVVVSASEVADRGVLVTGYAEHGAVNPGDVLEVVGQGGAGQVRVLSRQDLPGIPELEGFWLEGPASGPLRSGQTLAARHELVTAGKFTGVMYYLRPEEGGPSNVFLLLPGIPGGFLFEGASMSFWFRASAIHPRGNVSMEHGGQGLIPIEASLDSSVPLHRGQRFRLRDGDGRIVASGIVLAR